MGVNLGNDFVVYNIIILFYKTCIVILCFALRLYDDMQDAYE